jgi:CubicO group peptidase (beta-lactamase class C family)
MDASLIDAMHKRIYDDEFWFDSVIVVKNGYIVYEDYPSGNYNENSSHILHSATKSVTSMLIGTAIKNGFIEGVDSSVLDYFPDKTFANMSDAKQTITLEHILTMTPGLEWDEWSLPYDDLRNDLIASLMSGDIVQYLLDKPMVADPGEKWTYNTGCSNLLPHIIQRATNVSGITYARDYLFSPLGISSFAWRVVDGAPLGGHELFMRPRDMAKLGYLYLMNGTWDGQEIVTPDWVAESTKTHVDLDEKYPSWINDGYGYQWWTMKYDGWYYANGQDGQMICVLNDYNMVVVCTGYTKAGPYNAKDGPGPMIIRNYLIPAIERFTPHPTTTSRTEVPSYIFVLIFGIPAAVTVPLLAVRAFQKRSAQRTHDASCSPLN